MPTQPTLVQLGQWTFQVGDLLNAGLLIIAVATLWFTFLQMVRANRTQRASVFKEAYLGVFSQGSMLEALSIVEHPERFNLNDDGSAVDPDQETKVNELLAYADCVCAMYKLNLMPKRELRKFTYFFLVLYRNQKVADYCRFLQKWETKHTGGIPVRPYNHWVEYCMRKFKLTDIYAPSSNAQLGAADDRHSPSPSVAPGGERTISAT